MDAFALSSHMEEETSQICSPGEENLKKKKKKKAPC
jgi:hypothetical protein